MAGKRYAFKDGFLNQSFKDGKPARLETEWRAGGAILRNNRPWSTLAGQLSGDFFEVLATLQTSKVLLASIPLTSAAASSAPANQTAQEQSSISKRSLAVDAVLKADPEERTRLATEFYQLIGLDKESAQLLVMSTGVSNEMMVVLVVVVSRFYNLDHQYKNALTLLEKTLSELAEIDVTDSERAKYERALHNELGKTHYYLGNSDVALDHLQRAFEGYRSVQDAEGQAVALANLALIYNERADYQAALAADLEAIELQKGVIQSASSDPSNSLHNQLALFRAPLNLGTLYNNIGSFYHTLGQGDKAKAAYFWTFDK